MIEDHLVHSRFWTQLIFNYNVITIVHILIMLCCVRQFSAKILFGSGIFLSGQWRGIHQREDSWSGAPALHGLRHSYLDIEMDCKHGMKNRNIASCYQLLIIIFILRGNMADSFIWMWCVFMLYILCFLLIPSMIDSLQMMDVDGCQHSVMMIVVPWQWLA